MELDSKDDFHGSHTEFMLSHLSPRHASMADLKRALSIIKDNVSTSQTNSLLSRYHSGSCKRQTRASSSNLITHRDPSRSTFDSMLNDTSRNVADDPINFNNTNAALTSNENIHSSSEDENDVTESATEMVEETEEIEDLDTIEGLRAAVASRDERIALCVEMGQELITRLQECNDEHAKEIQVLKTQLEHQHTEIQKQRHLLLVLDSIQAERDELRESLDKNRQFVMELQHKEWIHKRLEEKLLETQNHSSLLDDSYHLLQEAFVSCAEQVKSDLFEWYSNFYLTEMLAMARVGTTLDETAAVHNTLLSSMHATTKGMLVLNEEFISVEKEVRLEIDELSMEFIRAICATAHSTVPSFGVVQLRNRVHAQDSEIAHLRDKVDELMHHEVMVQQLQYRNKLLQSQLNEKSVVRPPVGKQHDPTPISVLEPVSVRAEREIALEREVRGLRMKIGVLETLNAELRADNARPRGHR